MNLTSLLGLVIFCASILIPLLFSFLFTIRQVEKYETENSIQHLISFVSGLGLVNSCLLYIVAAIGTYFALHSEAFVFAIVASAFALLSAFLLGGNVIRTKTNFRKLHLN